MKAYSFLIICELFTFCMTWNFPQINLIYFIHKNYLKSYSQYLYIFLLIKIIKDNLNIMLNYNYDNCPTVII